MKILSSIRYLARQRLPLRSHNDSESSFRQLLLLRAENNPNFQEWLQRNALKTSLEISNLVKKSPKRESQLITIHTKGLFTENDEQNKTKTIRVFSDTRWTVRCGALVSIIQHYEELKELWKWYLKEYKDTETKARIIGVQTQLNKFNYFFGGKLANLLLRNSDNLSTTLQSLKLSAS